MNFYSFHIGDYASATRHLSWDEDAAYRRLLDAYYVREAPLPSELRQVFRLVSASEPGHREAVETVLREFFQETPEGWRNKRADAEISSAASKRTKAAQSAAARWSNANASQEHASASIPDANAMPTQCEGNAPNPNPNPTPKEEKPPTPRRGKGFDASLIETPDWLDGEVWRRWCKDRADRKKPITEEAARLQIGRLDKLRAEGHRPEDVLRHAIESGHQGLYPPKSVNGKHMPVSGDDDPFRGAV